jgi:hypothetical protein
MVWLSLWNALQGNRPLPTSSYHPTQSQGSPKSGIRAFPYKYCQPSQWCCQEDMAQFVLIDSAAHPVRPYRTSEHLTKKKPPHKMATSLQQVL